jgi:hypothetical protein
MANLMAVKFFYYGFKYGHFGETPIVLTIASKGEFWVGIR